MFETEFRVRYYETDAMGVVHHSNYLRWFEWARTEYLRAIGAPYRDMEAAGLVAVVVAATCKYHKPAHYDDLIRVRVALGTRTAVRFELKYEVWRGEQRLSTGSTMHAFLRDGRPLSLARDLPALDALFKAQPPAADTPAERGKK